MKIVTQFRLALGSLALCAGVNAYAAFFIPNSSAIQSIASLVGLCIMVYIWTMTYTRMEHPFALINKCAEQVANGDLTTKLCYTADDATNIEQTAAIAKDIDKMAGEVSHDVNNLISIVEEIRGTADKFTIKGSELMIIDRAKTDHLMFMDKIKAHLRGETRVDPAKLPDHHACRFGKWYDSDAKKKCGNLPSYRDIEQPHARIHALAKEAVSAHIAGDVKKAEESFNGMKGLSTQIANRLAEMKLSCNAAQGRFHVLVENEVPTLKEGAYVEVVVQDMGSGIPE